MSVNTNDIDFLNNLIVVIRDLIITNQENRKKITLDKLNGIDLMYRRLKNIIFLLTLLSRVIVKTEQIDILNTLILDYKIITIAFKKKIDDLLATPVDCTKVSYGPLQIITDDNGKRKLIRKATDLSSCISVILEESDIPPSVVYDVNTRNIVSELYMNTTELAKLSDPNQFFTQEELDYIKEFIIITSSVPNSDISDLKLYNDGTIIFQTSYNPTFTNSIKTKFSEYKSVIKVNLITNTKSTSNLPTNYSDNFNINYINKIISSNNQIFK